MHIARTKCRQTFGAPRPGQPLPQLRQVLGHGPLVRVRSSAGRPHSPAEVQTHLCYYFIFCCCGFTSTCMQLSSTNRQPVAKAFGSIFCCAFSPKTGRASSWSNKDHFSEFRVVNVKGSWFKKKESALMMHIDVHLSLRKTLRRHCSSCSFCTLSLCSKWKPAIKRHSSNFMFLSSCWAQGLKIWLIFTPSV